MSMDLKKIYDGSFSSRQRFDDGGSSYTQYDSTGNATPYTPSAGNSGMPNISSLTSGATTGANSIEGQQALVNSGVSNPADSGSANPGALSGALSALGSNKGAAVLSAITAILGAAGHMNTAKANATLPKMPALPGMPSVGGPLAALPGQGGSTGYGPPGGYNWQNYRGLTGATPGTGYAPRVQAPAPPLSSYYTYGQGPEQQFFQQVNPNGGQISPVTHKRGGRVKKFAMGGPMVQSGAMPRPVMPAAGGRPPMPRGPAMGAPMMGAPVTGAPMIGPQQGVPRPFATGGKVPHFDAGGLMLNTVYPAAENMRESAGKQCNGHPCSPEYLPQDIGEALSPKYDPNAHPVTKFSAAAHLARDAGWASGGAQQQGALSQPGQGSRYVQGPGDGTSDDIPARLANGEYVLSADVVSGLGNGDNSSGAKVLDGFVKNLRTHKAVNASKGKLPADAKPIHHYMKGGR